MKRQIWILGLLMLTLAAGGAVRAEEAEVSAATEACLGCHAALHPGIVADWENSRHAWVSPAQGQAAGALERRVSAAQIPAELQDHAVGCAECHTLRAERHADAFEHNGYTIHVVVSPDDCATCHPDERGQYEANLMAQAHANLADNPVYAKLEETILGTAAYQDGRLAVAAPDDLTRAEACYHCHGTRLALTGRETRETDFGELEFPVIAGWPNNGVGRINLDQSRGACTSCHTRHQFAVSLARKPETCQQCHVGPDVPVYKVYAASKHGNIYSAMKGEWDFQAIPWTVGQDFAAPTCAACHVSLLVDREGQTVNRRTHRMNDRLAWRQFGLIYAHAHPRTADTTQIRNREGLPLPTSFDGTPAHDFLIDANEQAQRRQTMVQTCRACHDRSWVEGHFRRYENTLVTTNAAVQAATRIMQAIWAADLADPGHPFDEAIERRWSDVWLFYASSTRFAAAMAGGGDYGVFAEGRYPLSRTILELDAWLRHSR
jgi:cytochrome c551/c552